MLLHSRDEISRGPVSARSRRLAADLSTTVAYFADEQTYQLQGRQTSSRFGREHGRQQASVMSRGRESTYATSAQLSMSRRLKPRPVTCDAVVEVQQDAALANQSGSSTMAATQQYAVSQQPAAGVAGPPGNHSVAVHHDMAGSHCSTAAATASGQKRGHSQIPDPSVDLIGTETHTAHHETSGYNTRAKRGRTHVQ